MKRSIISLLVLLISVSSVMAEIVTKDVDYKSGDTDLKGFIAYDNAKEGKRPGVIVVHEWWGHNDYSRSRAKQLAELGYVGLAVDMYGDGKTADHPDNAGKYMNEALSNMDAFQKKFEAGMKLLKSQEQTDPDHIAAIGYCFGGKTVLEMARAGVDLDGVVSFHGILATENPAKKETVNAKILAFNGADDPFVPQEQIDAFKKEMEQSGVEYEFVVFPGVKHSFTNPGATEVGTKYELPLVYDAEADKKSWAQTQEFLKKIFSE
jgi:dienelactone hydrolase